MANAEALGRTLDAIDHFSKGGTAWQDILRGCCEVVGGDSASFIMLDAGHQVTTVQSYEISAGAVAQYMAHFAPMDLMTPRAIGAAEGTWLDSDFLFSRADLGRNEYYVDFMSPHRMRQMLTHVVRNHPLDHSGLTVQRATPTSLARATLEGAPVRALVQALSQAIQARRSAAELWLDTLENAFCLLGEAICVLSARGSLWRMTSSAGLLFSQRAGLEIRLGKLWHADRTIIGAVYEALARVAAGSGRESLLLRGRDGLSGEVDISAAPARLCLGSSERYVMLRLRLLDKAKVVAGGSMRAPFGLTPAEELVLTALVAGRTPVQYAQAKGLSINTVRKQIAVVKEKVGCTRTVDLVIAGLHLQSASGPH